jgi:hypothetical protein
MNIAPVMASPVYDKLIPIKPFFGHFLAGQ